jgi:hypothetical protein
VTLEKLKDRAIDAVMNATNVEAFRFLDNTFMVVELTNGIAFGVDLMHPQELDRLNDVLSEGNPLRQFMLARNLGYKTLETRLENEVSRQLLHDLATYSANLTENVKHILKRHTGIEFKPIDFRRDHTKEKVFEV